MYVALPAPHVDTVSASAHQGVADLQTVVDIDFAREILLEDKIGAGAFGSVYRGVQALHWPAVTSILCTADDPRAAVEGERSV